MSVEQAEKSIRASNARFAAAVVAGDAEIIGQTYCADATLMFNSLPTVVGREAIVSFFLNLKRAGLTGIEFVTDTLRVLGDVGIEIGTFRVAASGEGPVTDDAGRYTIVHRREPDGAWRILVDVPQSMG